MTVGAGLVGAYIALWLVLVNFAIALPPKMWAKAMAWFLTCLAMLALGWLADFSTYTQPHNAYIMWEFFATFFIASAVMALPAGLWLFFKR